MPTYLFYQKKGGPTPWECALAGERERLTLQDKVEFITVLDVDNSFATELTQDETAAVKYGAPLGFYMDFDGDIDEVLGQSKLLLLKLQDEKKFDITQARIYLTGGRGVHIEIPLACFAQKIPPAGVPMLPAIFKEIAMAIYVDTLDTRIYSGRKGRQWRVPNVKRSNGLYKVQVTADEFLECTPENYAAICAAPRAPLPLTPPTFNAHLGLLYMQAQEKVGVAVKRRKQAKKTDGEVSRFEGQWPKSVQLLLMGEALRPTAGWNQIALQLAAFAIALGKTEDQFIEDARELILRHQGDSDRYGTPKKREREMRNQYRYQDDNPGYSFSLGGVKSLFAKGISTADLDWTGVDTGGDDAPAEAASNEEIDEIIDEVVHHGEDNRVTFGRNGIFALTQDGPKCICPLGLVNGLRMVDRAGNNIGFEFDVYQDGKSVGRWLIPQSQLASKASFNSWVLQHSTWLGATDQQIGYLIDAMRRKTEKTGSTVIVAPREGVDVMRPPGAKDENEIDLIFASKVGCLHPDGRTYTFRGMHVSDGTFKTDLLNAPEMNDTPEMREFLDRLFCINKPETVGKIMGWFVAAFLCQTVRHYWQAFPLLQIWGEAGAGKSKTAELFSHMHYHIAKPKKISSAGNTFFPMMAAVTQSASIPVIFEELKPRQMAKYQLDAVQNLMRTNYTGDAIERGGINKDVAQGGVVVNGYDNVAPIVFLGESVEAQSAIFERCVSAPLTKQDRFGCSENYDYVHARRHTMGVIGRTLVTSALSANMPAVRDSLEAHLDIFRKRVGQVAFEDMNRPWRNYATVITGLDFLKLTLRRVFGARYDETIENLKDAVVSDAITNTRKVVSEAAKVLDVLGQLTRNTDIQYRLEKNQDYWTDGTHVDIRMRQAYAKYVRYQLSLKQEVLFDNDRAFLEGMRKYAGLESDAVPGSPLFRTVYEPVFRFKVESLQSDGCEPFEP